MFLLLDTRHVFDFFDQNDDSCLSYLEFRSWMLLVDRTLAEDELLQLFHDVDQDGSSLFFFLHLILNLNFVHRQATVLSNTKNFPIISVLIYNRMTQVLLI